ncbi:unnamed protein product [Fusarium fujikuroi]|nr:unnamed protein product [Fusarium fujikuroi]
MSTINTVKYFFHKGNVPCTEAQRQRLIALAYQTARSQELYPKEVFIRSNVHEMSTIKGKRLKDPRGAHITLSYKTEDFQGRNTHVSCHGYTTNFKTLEFSESIKMKEKRDTSKKRGGKIIWPAETQLWEAPGICTLRNDVLSSARLVYYNYGLSTFVSPASSADRSDFQGA